MVAELCEVSGSERYGDAWPAPVLIPPLFLSFGMPPANNPANWGAVDIPSESAPTAFPPVSLVLRARFVDDELDGGGARPLGGFGIPGIGGALPSGIPPELPVFFSTRGADRSFVTAFFSFAPLVISVSRAPLPHERQPNSARPNPSYVESLSVIAFDKVQGNNTSK